MQKHILSPIGEQIWLHTNTDLSATFSVTILTILDPLCEHPIVIDIQEDSIKHTQTTYTVSISVLCRWHDYFSTKQTTIKSNVNQLNHILQLHRHEHKWKKIHLLISKWLFTTSNDNHYPHPHKSNKNPKIRNICQFPKLQILGNWHKFSLKFFHHNKIHNRKIQTMHKHNMQKILRSD